VAPLSTAFLAVLDEPARARFAARAGLEESLTGLLAAARASWPEVAADAGRFVAHLAARLGPEDDALERVHGPDLFLAFACLEGDERAIRRLDELLVAATRPALGRMRLPDDLVDEAQQALRLKLLVATEEGPPRLASYSGGGQLKSWFAAAAVRTALNLMRGKKAEPLDEDALVLERASGDDPETAALRRRCAGDLEAALREAFTSLTARERLVLRHHFVDQLSTEEIGRLYDVHRVTVLRWITRARERLAALAERRLASKLGLAEGELSSMRRLVRSQVDFSLSRLFATPSA
jgi:RNA polymerase sigma-70 factor (ECF subfamily)